MKASEEFFRSISPEDNWPGVEEWKPICVKIALCLQRVDRLVQELRLDTPTFQRLYLEMLDVRKAWIRFMNASEPDELEEEEREVTVYRKYLPVFDRMIGNLKKLIIGNRQRA